MRRLGMKVYESDPTSVAAVGRETRAIGGVLGRTRAANALATQDRERRRARPSAASAPPARARDPRRRPHAVRDARQLLGRRRRAPRPAATLLTQGLTSPSGTAQDLRRDRGQAQPGHHHRRPARQPRATSRASPPTTATTRTGATRARCKNKRVYVATGNSLLQPYPGVASTIRDVRAQVPEELELTARTLSVVARRHGRAGGRRRGVDGVRRGARPAARTSGTSLTGQAEDGPLQQIIVELRLPRTVSAIDRRRGAGRRGRAAAGRAGQPARLAGRDRRHRRRGLRRDADAARVAERDRAAAGRRARLRGAWRRRSCSRSAGRARTPGSIGRVILAGIAISALFGAATTSLMVAYSDRVQSAIFWLAGGLSSEGWSSLERRLAVLRGRVRARGRSSRARWTGSRWATTWPPRSAGTRGACGCSRPARRRCWRPRAAALAGLLGFLGLVIPHLVRLAGGTSSHRFVIPASALAGAALLRRRRHARARRAGADRAAGRAADGRARRAAVPVAAAGGRVTRAARGARRRTSRIGDVEILARRRPRPSTRASCVAVVGPNGAGKSTLSRAVSGLQPLERGDVRWGGTPLERAQGPQDRAPARVHPPARARARRA